MTTATTIPAGLTAAEYLYPDLTQEHATTRRMLERFPNEHAAWRPHERSRTLGDLATHVANIPNLGGLILSNEDLDMLQRKPVGTLTDAAALVAFFDAARTQLDVALAATDVASLEQTFTMRRGDRVLFSAPRRLLMRTVVASHLGHHRAQLGVYYRLLGVPLPVTYGPSADEAF